MRARTLNGIRRDNATFRADGGRSRADVMTGEGGKGWLKAISDVVKKWGPEIADLVSSFFSGHSAGYKRWENAGPGVHDWFTQSGRQAFLDWMDAHHPDGFGSIEEVKSYLPFWAFTLTVGDAFMIFPDGWGYYQPALAAQWYAEGITEAAYKTMGIDYAATFAAMQAINRNNVTQAPDSVVYLDTGYIPDTSAVIAQDAVDAMNSGQASAKDLQLIQDLMSAGVAWMDPSGAVQFDPNGPPPNTPTVDPSTGDEVLTPPPPTTASAPIIPLLLLGGAVLYTMTSK